jgi:hypothetical protein
MLMLFRVRVGVVDNLNVTIPSSCRRRHLLILSCQQIKVISNGRDRCRSKVHLKGRFSQPLSLPLTQHRLYPVTKTTTKTLTTTTTKITSTQQNSTNPTQQPIPQEPTTNPHQNAILRKPPSQQHHPTLHSRQKELARRPLGGRIQVPPSLRTQHLQGGRQGGRSPHCESIHRPGPGRFTQRMRACRRGAASDVVLSLGLSLGGWRMEDGGCLIGR